MVYELIHRHPELTYCDGDDSVEKRQMWLGGNQTGIIDLSREKYPWARQIYKQMRSQIWKPEDIDTTDDKNQFKLLTEDERRAYIAIFGYLTFLDSIQVMNLPYIKTPITACDLHPVLAEQISEEALHMDSYQWIGNSILSPDELRKMYDYWHTDKMLKDRCTFISSLYQNYVDNQTTENYFYALVGDYLLESLYFYNSFAFYYNLRSRGLMLNTAEMILEINKDEILHVRLFQKLVEEGLRVLPHSKEKIEEMFRKTVEQEIEWNNYIIGNNIIGMSPQHNEEYIKHLANLRYNAIGLGKLYDEDYKNPYLHLNVKIETTSGNNEKGDFFSSSIASDYVQDVEGWDEF
jgi:ribonucleoside-diphosphate reductase beta chain